MHPEPTRALEVVAQPRRRSILRIVWDNELSAGEIAERVPISFPAVSQHLRKLLNAGLVTVRQEGRRRYYRARRGDMGTLEIYLEQMWSESLDRLKTLAESAEDAHDRRSRMTRGVE